MTKNSQNVFLFVLITFNSVHYKLLYYSIRYFRTVKYLVYITYFINKCYIFIYKKIILIKLEQYKQSSLLVSVISAKIVTAQGSQELLWVVWRGNVAVCLWRWRLDLHLGYRSRPSLRMTPARITEREWNRAYETNTHIHTCNRVSLDVRTCEQRTCKLCLWCLFRNTHTFLFLILWQKQYYFEAIKQKHSWGDNSFALVHKLKHTHTHNPFANCYWSHTHTHTSPP